VLASLQCPHHRYASQPRDRIATATRQDALHGLVQTHEPPRKFRPVSASAWSAGVPEIPCRCAEIGLARDVGPPERIAGGGAAASGGLDPDGGRWSRATRDHDPDHGRWLADVLRRRAAAASSTNHETSVSAVAISCAGRRSGSCGPSRTSASTSACFAPETRKRTWRAAPIVLGVRVIRRSPGSGPGVATTQRAVLGQRGASWEQRSRCDHRCRGRAARDPTAADPSVRTSSCSYTSAAEAGASSPWTRRTRARADAPTRSSRATRGPSGSSTRDPPVHARSSANQSSTRSHGSAVVVSRW